MLINPVKINSPYISKLPNLNNFGISFGAKLKAQPKEDVFVKSTNQTNPITSSVNPNYSDTEKFSEYLNKKMEDMLEVKSEKDVVNMVEKLSDETGMKKEKIYEIVSRLTQFSSYRNLPALQRAIEPLESYAIYNRTKGTVDLNNVFYYLSYHKNQINGFYGNQSRVMFLDRQAIQRYKELEKEEPDIFYDYVIPDINKGDIKVALIDGWSAKINGKDVSQTMFGAPLSLEESTREIINAMQEKGITLDEALNGDMIREAKELFGKNTKIEILKNDMAKNKSPKNIAARMRPLYPSKEQIKGVIDLIVTNEMQQRKPDEQQKGRELLSEYFDEMLDIYSPQNLDIILKDMHKKIEDKVKELGKTMDDVVYLIPNDGKSFSVINYQYAKVNDIDPSKLVKFDGFGAPNQDLDNKVAVVLDDVVGSGHSMAEDEFSYRFYIKNKNIAGNKNVIFAPISAQKAGISYLEDTIDAQKRTDKDFIIPYNVRNFDNLLKKYSGQDKYILRKVTGESNYGDENACTSFPYMTPDNNSEAAGFLLGYTLNNTKANKTCGWFNQYAKWLKD